MHWKTFAERLQDLWFETRAAYVSGVDTSTFAVPAGILRSYADSIALCRLMHMGRRSGAGSKPCRAPAAKVAPRHGPRQISPGDRCNSLVHRTFGLVLAFLTLPALRSKDLPHYFVILNRPQHKSNIES